VLYTLKFYEKNLALSAMIFRCDLTIPIWSD